MYLCTNMRLKKEILHTLIAGVSMFLLLSCGQGKQSEADQRHEDIQAKKLIQGVWLSDEDGSVAFLAKGDTIFYPDSTSLPAYFQVFEDTIVLHGVNDVKYQILKQSEHLFQFKNQMGEVVTLTKSSDLQDLEHFETRKGTVVLNQNQVVKHDTVVSFGSERYHCYVQVNPTTYKVRKTVYNNEGVSVENVYSDNIVNLCIYQGSKKLYSSDFYKKDFGEFVEGEMLNQLILSDMEFAKIDKDGIHYHALMAVPDSPSSMVVSVLITYNGKLVKKSATR